METTDLLLTADAQAWALAALATSLQRDDPDRAAAAQRVLDAFGVASPAEGASPKGVAAQARSSLLQAAAAAGSQTVDWGDLPDEVLVLQGEASAQGAQAFRQFVLPTLDGMLDRFNAPNARMLDVGTGIGALARAWADVFPTLQVTGIDTSRRVLDLAGQRPHERVALRCQSVTDLDEIETYDLVWVPAPFLAEKALRDGLARCLAALKPGGWLLLGHGKGSGDPLQEALTGFKTLTLGGTFLLEPDGATLLAEVGFSQVTNLPTPPGAPGLTAGRRPER